MPSEALPEGKYIYGITRVGEGQNLGAIGIGGRGDNITTVPHQELACVVSNSPIAEYPVTRENSMAHQKVIEAVMKTGAVLPVRFGTIGVSEQVIVEKVLTARYDELANLLTWVSDKREIGVKVYWRDLQRVFQELARVSERVGSLVGALSGKKPEATYYDRIEVGKTLEELLKKKREETADYIFEALHPHTCEAKRNATYGDAMILNGAFFVPASQEAAFHSVVEQLEVELGSNVRVKLITGAPPFNFVTITIHWEDAHGISGR